MNPYMTASQEVIQWIQSGFMVGMLVMLGIVLNKLSELHSTAGALWKAVNKLPHQIDEVHCRVDNVHSMLNEKSPGRFTVLVIGRYNDESPFVWGMTGTIRYCEEQQVAIPLRNLLKKGAVVICTGEAELVSVLAGSRENAPWSGGGSPICFIQDDLGMGVQITARVRSTKS